MAHRPQKQINRWPPCEAGPALGLPQEKVKVKVEERGKAKAEAKAKAKVKERVKAAKEVKVTEDREGAAPSRACS